MHRVRGGEDLLERGDVGISGLARFDLADAEVVVERAQAIDVGEDALERGGERPIVERGIDRLEVPARRAVGGGHGVSSGWNSMGRDATSQLPTAVCRLTPDANRGGVQRVVTARSTSWICMRARAAPMQ